MQNTRLFLRGDLPSCFYSPTTEQGKKGGEEHLELLLQCRESV